MTLLGKIQRGRTRRPPRVLIYGTPGIGKSTFAAAAPAPIFVPTEDGLDEIDCAKFPLSERLEDVLAYLDALRDEDHEFGTVAVDSLDWLETLVWDKTCRDFGTKNIEKVDGGYAKGYTHALDRWQEVVARLDDLRNRKGMAVVLVAHAKVERFQDPEAAAYDRYSPRLHKHACDLFIEWCDAILFATRKIRTQSEDAGFNRKRTIAHAVGKDGGERVLRAVGGPSCVAKNRYGIIEELPLAWGAFEAALAAHQESDSNQAQGA